MRHQGVSLLKGGAFTIYAIFKLLPKQRKLVLISRLNTKTSIDFQQIVGHTQLRIGVLKHMLSTLFVCKFRGALTLSDSRYLLEKSRIGGVL